VPIDPSQVLEHPPIVSSTEWAPSDVLLYHLGLGAGSNPTDPRELEYVIEDRLKVLPTFPLVVFRDGFAPMLNLPGLNLDLGKILHAEQEIRLHRAVPAAGRVTATDRVSGLYDKGRDALVTFESEATSEAGPMWTSRATLFVRDAGGFGGDRGPATSDLSPEREPDTVVETPTLPQQALLYRLNGDANPLHADPDFAAAAGFPQPILHGLCTYGIVGKALIDTCLDGDVRAVSRYSARFSGVVYPGETLLTQIWRENGRLLARSTTKERGLPVMTRTVLEVAG